jgi:hypothetical protein
MARTANRTPVQSAMGAGDEPRAERVTSVGAPVYRRPGKCSPFIATLRGAEVADVKKRYRMHPDIDRANRTPVQSAMGAGDEPGVERVTSVGAPAYRHHAARRRGCRRQETVSHAPRYRPR